MGRASFSRDTNIEDGRQDRAYCLKYRYHSDIPCYEIPIVGATTMKDIRRCISVQVTKTPFQYSDVRETPIQTAALDERGSTEECPFFGPVHEGQRSTRTGCFSQRSVEICNQV